MKITSIVFLLCWVMIFCQYTVVANRVYGLRSIYRFKHQSTNCNLLKAELNSKGEPSGVSNKGNCCDKKKHTDFKVRYFVTNRGLGATFQWSHDSRYYLTAKSVGDQLYLEKPGSSIADNHKFILKSTSTPGCRDCVSVQSKATNKYLSSGSNGQVSMTTNRKLHTALFVLHKCKPIWLAMCAFLDMSCSR